MYNETLTLASNSTKIDISQFTQQVIDISIMNQDDTFQRIIDEDNESCRDDEESENSNKSDYSECEDESKQDVDNEYEYYDEKQFEEENIEDIFSEININPDNISPLVFTTTNRKGRKLLCDGYSYVKDRGDFELTQWKCKFSVRIAVENNKQKSVYCPGGCHTINDRVMKTITEHHTIVADKLHLPDLPLM